jgi:hypothetical protein
MSEPRTYRLIAGPSTAVAVGTVADVTPHDAMTPTYQGWLPTGLLCGPTSARPTPGADMPAPGNCVQAGIAYLDTTLAYVVVSDGAGNWLNPATGEVV